MQVCLASQLRRGDDTAMVGDLCASACGIHIFAHFDCLVETGAMPTSEIEGAGPAVFSHLAPAVVHVLCRVTQETCRVVHE